MGQYQSKNVKTVLTVCDIMKQNGWRLEEEHIKSGLREVKSRTGLRGRFDIVQYKPTVILDVSHNEAGLKEVFAQVQKMDYDQLYIVVGFARDKELHKVLALFPSDAKYMATQAQILRALPYQELNDLLLEGQKDSTPSETVTKALETIVPNLKENDLLLVTGSFFILDEAYTFFQNKD